VSDVSIAIPTAGSTRPGPFTRDRTTVVSYSAVGVFAFDLYAFGPALALLRPELHLSYAMVGVHSAAWAVGTIAASAVFGRVVRLVGRRRVFWLSAAGLAAGSVVFGLAYVVALSLLGALIMGFAGTTLLTAAQAVLSDRHGRRREQALVEANIGAGACGVVAPLLLAGLGQTAATWRVAMVVPVIGVALAWLAYRHLTLPEGPPPAPPAVPAADGSAADGSAADGSAADGSAPVSAGLSRAYWTLAVLVALGVGIEFCPIYFGAELLVHTEHLSTSGAGAALSLFYAGLLAGRMIGGRLTRRPGRARPVIVASLAVVTVGFGVLWLVPVLVAALVGLFVAGLGVANLYPLSASLALATAPGRADAANANVQLLGGVVALAAPLALGALADAIGLTAAFAVEPLLIVGSAFALRAGSRRHPSSGVLQPQASS
jgi:MFS family permease